MAVDGYYSGLFAFFAATFNLAVHMVGLLLDQVCFTGGTLAMASFALVLESRSEKRSYKIPPMYLSSEGERL